MTGDISPMGQQQAQTGCNPDDDSRIPEMGFSESCPPDRADLQATISATSPPDPTTSNGGQQEPASNQVNQPAAIERLDEPVAGPSQSNANKQQQATDDNNDSTYHLKWIPWNSGMVPIVMQSINGPCPLIATMNVLLLREKIKLPQMLEQITESQLLAYIGESIMDSMPADAEKDENIQLNMEQNVNDAIEILPKLKTGLDVNIRFTGITDFEYTPECIIFDLLRIPLYHGWLSDPELVELQNAIGQQSYNQLVDNIITNKANQDPEVATRVIIAEEFLEKTASQLTLHGLNQLKGTIKDNEIGILFRNNHFLTLFKREGEIYTLVTDHGYLTEDNIIWETLDNIEGAGRFFDANFQLSEMTNRQVSEMNAIDERQKQMVNDYLVALSLKDEESKADVARGASSQRELDDLEVARKLQAEEDRYYAEMIDKKEQASVDPKNLQVALRPSAQDARDDEGRNYLNQISEPSPAAETPAPAPAPMWPSDDNQSNQRTYAKALETRSIWGTDRRSEVEQADSWNNEQLARDSRLQSSYASEAASSQLPQAGAPVPARNQAADSHAANDTDREQSIRQAQQPTNPGDDPCSTNPVSSSTSQNASSSQQQQQQQHQRPRQSGGAGGGTSRRSRSEKSSKDSNCTVQ